MSVQRRTISYLATPYSAAILTFHFPQDHQAPRLQNIDLLLRKPPPDPFLTPPKHPLLRNQPLSVRTLPVRPPISHRKLLASLSRNPIPPLGLSAAFLHFIHRNFHLASFDEGADILDSHSHVSVLAVVSPTLAATLSPTVFTAPYATAVALSPFLRVGRPSFGDSGTGQSLNELGNWLFLVRPSCCRVYLMQ